MSNEPARQNEPIQGKVAVILNERELVMNIGASSGVQEGMKFKVLSSEETKIHDPDTNEVLGSVNREKTRVRTIEVEERFSICRTYRTTTVGGGALGWFAESINLYKPPRQVTETFRAGNSDYLPPLSEEESFVKKGDRVVQLGEDD